MAHCSGDERCVFPVEADASFTVVGKMFFGSEDVQAQVRCRVHWCTYVIMLRRVG